MPLVVSLKVNIQDEDVHHYSAPSQKSRVGGLHLLHQGVYVLGIATLLSYFLYKHIKRIINMRNHYLMLRTLSSWCKL